MDLLKVEHPDFRIIVECSNYYNVWNRAKGNIGESSLTATYTWPNEVSSVTLYPDSEEELEIRKGEPSKALFFDNVDYPVWIEFNNNVKSASFGSYLKTENDKFSFRRHILAGCLNYGNEVGKSELNFCYTIGSETKYFSFGFEVLSSKLNYHEHWRSIIEDIEREYRLLSIDYMKRTFHGFSTSQEGENNDLIWWSVFASEQEKFVKACKNIIDRPRHRLRGHDAYLRADKLKRIPVLLENELAEHCKETNHLYKVQEQQLSNDTQENRFLKYAVTQIAGKYERLKNNIENFKNVSAVLKEKMDKSLTDLKRIQHHSFFRTVGQFKGLTQENQVLQKAINYSQAFRTWQLLHKAYSLNDGLYHLQTKDIATLYEIWCFIEVAHIVKDQLGLTNEEVDQSRPEMNGLFTWSLSKDGNSTILFKKDNVELAELVYNPTHTDKNNDDLKLEGLVSPTVPQKPDIVLQLTKHDLQKNMKLTYLFDAKYRIDGKEKGVDVPPEDAINQMHRYRDAIYYKDKMSTLTSAEDFELKKEVIGGYILFPGDGTPLDVQESKFQQTIKKVNIGAFPLRPKDVENRKLLEKFIKGLIETKAVDTIAAVIPQKGATIEVPNRILVGLVKEDNKYYDKFEEGRADLYYTGTNFPTTVALHNLHYFMPYFKGKGIRDVYEILKIRTITTKEAKGDDNFSEKDDLRLAFELRFERRLFDDYVKINLDISHTFKDTTFDELTNDPLS